MPAARYISETGTLEIKSQIEKRIGHSKAEKYFDLLGKFLGCKISKPDFDKLCIGILGRENVRLHNHLLRSILKRACLAKTLPKINKEQGFLDVGLPNGYQRSSMSSLCRDIPESPLRGYTHKICDRKIGDRPSPLGPHAKQNPVELLSFGSKVPSSVEDGEDVDRGLGIANICSRSLVTAPLGISINNRTGRKRKCLMSSCPTETCYLNGELPDTTSLHKRLMQKLEVDGIEVSSDCANLLNGCLDGYLKRLIKPCLDLACSRYVSKQKQNMHNQGRSGLNQMLPKTYAQKSSEKASISMLDFQIATEINPSVLGPDWSLQLEKVLLHTLEQ